MNARSKTTLSAWLAAVASFSTLGGCANPQIGGIDRYVATTPETYSDARVFFLDKPLTEGDYRPALRPMKAAFEINHERAPEFKRAFTLSTDALPGSAVNINRPTEPSARSSGESATRSEFVRHNQPLSVIVNKVIAPSYSGTRDLAVVLDILTKGDQHVQPLVVWYQRDVPGGKELGFENLLVYFDAAWDSKMPPYFRLRLINVRTEDNAATRSVLESVQKLAGSFVGLIPHPIMPGVELGLEAAKQVLGNQNNTLLMDYTVQFYSAADRREFGGADLGFLTTGHWIAVGLNRYDDAEQWRIPHYFDQKTLRVYGPEDLEKLREAEENRPLDPPPPPRARRDGSAIEDNEPKVSRTAYKDRLLDRPRVDAPIILMTIATAESVVPTIVLDRSEELIKYLSDSPSKMNFDALQSTLNSLTSGVKTFVTKRRVERDQTQDDMSTLFGLLKKHKAATSDGASADNQLHKLSEDDVQLLLLTLERTTGQSDKNGLDAWLTWWESSGKKGAFVDDPENPGRKVWKAE